MTAASVVEFAEEVGVVAPQRVEEDQARLQGLDEFEARVQEWTMQDHSAGTMSKRKNARECVDSHASQAGKFFSKWITEDWTAALWATANTVAAGAGSAAATRRFRPRALSGSASAA